MYVFDNEKESQWLVLEKQISFFLFIFEDVDLIMFTPSVFHCCTYPLCVFIQTSVVSTIYSWFFFNIFLKCLFFHISQETGVHIIVSSCYTNYTIDVSLTDSFVNSRHARYMYLIAGHQTQVFGLMCAVVTIMPYMYHNFSCILHKNKLS